MRNVSRRDILGIAPRNISSIMDDSSDLLTGNRIITYQNLDGKVYAVRNAPYIETLKTKIDNLVSYFLAFHTFSEVSNLFREKFEEFEKRFKNFFDEGAKFKEVAGTFMVKYADEYKYAIATKTAVEEYKDLTATVGLVENNQERASIISFVEELKMQEHYRLREQKKKKASMEAEGKEKALSSKQNLGILQDMLERYNSLAIFEEFNAFKEFIGALRNYYQSIIDRGNLLDQELSTYDLENHIRDILEKFQTLKREHMSIVESEQSIRVNSRLIPNNDEIADLKVKIAIEEAIQDFLKAEYEDCRKKYEEKKEILDNHINRLIVKNLQTCVEQLTKNDYALLNGINRLSINHDIQVNNSTISASIGLNIPSISISQVNPYNYVLSPDDQQLLGYIEQLKEYMDNLLDRINYINVLKAELTIRYERENKIRAEASSHANLENNNYDALIDGCGRLLQRISDERNVFKPEYMSSLIGVLFEILAIRSKPKCCSSIPNKFMSTDITVPDVYKSICDFMASRNKVRRSACCGSDIDLVHRCSSLDVRELLNIFTYPRVVGGIKTETGHEQETHNGIRNEDISYSLFVCIKESTRIITLQKMIEIGFRTESAKKTLMEYGRKAITIATANQYHSVADKIQRLSRF
jgi:hypothetical protein